MPSPQTERRDEFAMAALSGIISDKDVVAAMRHRADDIGKTYQMQLAELAFSIADAMEAAR